MAAGGWPAVETGGGWQASLKEEERYGALRAVGVCSFS